MAAELVEAPLGRVPAERILLIRLGALGDVVRTRFVLPALRELYPEARVDWLVDDRSAGGLSGVVGLDGVHVLPRRDLEPRRPLRALRRLRGLIERLSRADYELCLDFHSNLRSAMLARLSGIPVRIGFAPPLAREQAHRLMTHTVRLRHPHVSRFERNAALVRFVGGGMTSEAPALDLPTDEAISAELAPGLRASGFLAIHPGTSPGTEYKRWPAERFGQVAARVARETGLRSLVTFGPGERGLALTVVSASDGAAELAPETSSIGRLLSLLGHARLLLGADSGPAHLAALASCPQVVVFGPTDPIENAPFAGVPSRLVRSDVGCNPCREGCPLRTCLASVGVDQVTEATLGLLGELSRRGVEAPRLLDCRASPDAASRL